MRQKTVSSIFAGMQLINLSPIPTKSRSSPMRKLEEYGLKGGVSVERTGCSLSINRILRYFVRILYKVNNAASAFISYAKNV